MPINHSNRRPKSFQVRILNLKISNFRRFETEEKCHFILFFRFISCSIHSFAVYCLYTWVHIETETFSHCESTKLTEKKPNLTIAKDIGLSTRDRRPETWRLKNWKLDTFQCLWPPLFCNVIQPIFRIQFNLQFFSKFHFKLITDAHNCDR